MIQNPKTSFFWKREFGTLVLYKTESGNISEVRRWDSREHGAEAAIIAESKRLNREVENG